MHEGNFTQQIVDAILTAVHEYPGRKPTSIKVKVGEMLHLNRESVKTHFEAITRGGILENARLDLEEIPVLVICQKCNAQWQPEDHHLLLCDLCSATDVKIISGNSVTVDSIQLQS